MLCGRRAVTPRSSVEFFRSMLSPCHRSEMGRILTSLILLTIVICAQAADEVVVKQIEPKQKELKCFKCLDYEPHCQSLTNRSVVDVATCAPEETFCQVQRQHLNDDLITFERRCASSCTPGCENAGDYKRCSSCCKEHLCNTDNSVPGIASNQLIITTVTTFGRLVYLALH